MSVIKALFACLLLTSAAIATEDPPNPALVPPAPMHEQVLHLPGDPDRPASLVVTLYTPDGPGPFPLAVMNHGSSGNGEARAQAPRYRFTMSAYYFLSRGYAVALPMMRGFAGSGGQMGQYGCNLTQLAQDNAADILAVITDLGGNPQIDTSRVVVAGQSFGGWNTLGVGSLQSRRVRGLIDFVGGVQSSQCNQIEDDGEAMARAAERMSTTTLVPSIWFYGENDSLFGPAIWRPMHDAYVKHGADAELVDVGVFMNDSHQMLSHPESIPLWTPRLDAFLARIGMPSREVFPHYMPIPWPAPTHFAAIDDVAAVPWITPDGRRSYAKFLTLQPPRVFSIAVSGQSVVAQGGFDPVARAAQACRAHNLVCVPYAIDSDVVFIRPAAVRLPTRATSFAALGDVDAVPWINEKGRAAYRAFLAHAKPRAFVIGTAGEFLGIYDPPDPASNAMMMCANAHITCRAYAVDDAVVWVPPPPAARPRTTHYAAIGDAAAVPWLAERNRPAYLHFLTIGLPRAFAVAPGGQAVTTQGGYDPAGRALAKCRQAGLSCRLYAVDDDVVWN